MSLFMTTLAFTACTPTQQEVDLLVEPDPQTVTITDADASEDTVLDTDTNEVVRAGVYTPYTDDVLMNGQTKVLFFHASWCPTCKKANTDLLEMYANEGFAVSTYKIDYDTAKELKQKYLVQQQHTFIVVDGEGNEVDRLIGGTRAQLDELLDKASA